MTDDRDWTPTAMPRAEMQPCLCAHHWIWHIAQDAIAGRCEVPGCGCKTFREDTHAMQRDTRRRIDAEKYDPSPEPIQRRTR